MASILLSCSEDKSSPSDPDPTPNPPAETGIFLKLSTSIEAHSEITDNQSRGGIVGAFQPDDEIGLFYNDTCVNRKLTFNGTNWSGGNIILAPAQKNIYCYFPYDNSITSHDAISLNIESQTDYLVGSASVGELTPTVEVKMKHVLSLVRIILKKNNYDGVGHVESVFWNGVYKNATYNVITNTIVPMGEKNSFQVGGNYTLDDSEESVVVEAILLPVNTGTGVSLTVVIDGEERVYQIPEVHVWEPAKAYTYELILKGGYNSPIELEEYAIDVSHWSTFGKTDQIVLSVSDKDWFDVEPGEIAVGSDVYRNEGRMFGFFGYWMGYDPGTGNMPEKWEGDFRMVLMDDAGNIVDKYQPCSIIAENGGMMKGTSRRSYVIAPVGTYELGVLFRKKGETTWQKANRLQKVTKADMSYTIQEQTNLPALRMIQVDEETNTGVIIHNRPYGSNFNITYILSNRGKIALKGEIKAVWERTFDYNGHCYRPCDKRTNTINDEVWQDEIGRVSIDLKSNVRFWNGIIPCAFPVKRKHPQTSDGIGYCTPLVHLYWKSEGNSEWVLLRLDMDPILAAQVNTSQDEANLWLQALNYVSLKQSHWY
jgi:hypothetical protein